MTVLSTSSEHRRVRAPQALSNPSLRPVGDDDLLALQKILSARSLRADSYSQSASYYAMTGREGLWLYSTDDTFMLIAAHPNSDNHLLLFPPMGKEPASLLNQIVRDERIFTGEGQPVCQLARMSGQDQLLLEWAQASGHFKTAPEELLDWKHSAHTLSTKALIERRGQKFRDFRKGILRAERDGLSATLVESPADKAVLSGLAEAWARNTVHDGYSDNDLTAPTRAIIRLMETTKLPLHAMIIRKGDKPVGFIAWEETNPDIGLANSMGNVAINGKGVSEFSYLAMAEVLSERGFNHVFIGGSESKGLDAFKRKMDPVKSVPLQSAFTHTP